MLPDRADVVAALAQHGYVVDGEIATALFLADRLAKPILIEGEAGVGKTEIARVLARLANTELIRLQCYEGLDAAAALYEWNYHKQIIRIRLGEAQGAPAPRLEDMYTEEFLLQRPILRALRAPRPTVLLLDEVDRADEEFEALLLETLGEFQMTIPEFGTVRATHPPFVILTSNRTRELTDALRRRCLYLWIGYPSFQKEYAVVQLAVPAVNEALAAGAVSLVQALRREKLNKVPGLAETIDWVRALQSTGVTMLDPGSVAETAGCLLKDRDDIVHFRGTLAPRLLDGVGVASF